MTEDWKNNCATYTYGYTPEYCKTNATIDMYEGYTKNILIKDLADTLDKTLSTSILKIVEKLTKTEILVLITKALASWDVMYGS